MGPSRPRSVVLDAGALVAFERNDRRVRRLIELAAEHGASVHVPAGVVGQVWRDGSRQVRLVRLLKSGLIDVQDLDLDEVSRGRFALWPRRDRGCDRRQRRAARQAPRRSGRDQRPRRSSPARRPPIAGELLEREDLDEKRQNALRFSSSTPAGERRGGDLDEKRQNTLRFSSSTPAGERRGGGPRRETTKYVAFLVEHPSRRAPAAALVRSRIRRALTG